MKMTIIGIEAMHGMGKSSGEAYSMGRLHTAAPLAPPAKAEWMAKGQMGTTYDCDENLVRKIGHLPFPVVVEVEIEDVIRFGKRQQVVTDIKPVEVSRKAA